MDVLLVGLGRWGEKHLRVLRELGAAVWVADVVPERDVPDVRELRPPVGQKAEMILCEQRKVVGPRHDSVLAPGPFGMRSVRA